MTTPKPAVALLLGSLVVALAASSAAASSRPTAAVAAEPGATAYIKAIKQPYLRFRAAFHVAVGPCGNRPSPKRCEPANVASTAAALAFKRVLGRAKPSPALSEVHRVFLGATRRYLAANRAQLAVVRAGRSTTKGFSGPLHDLDDASVAVNIVVPRALPAFLG